MSDMQPKGIPVTVDGVERHFLFTLAVVDEVQDHYNMPVNEVIQEMNDDMKVYGVTAYLTMSLTNDDIIRSGSKEDLYTLDRINRVLTVPMMDGLIAAILQAYGISVPEPDEDDDPNGQRSRKS